MRHDLNKLLCERERRGSRLYSYKDVRRAKHFAVRDADDTHVREGMKLRYGYDDKSFNENLRPLLGAVRKAVGRPYAKFYSELSEVFDKRSVINQHILLHLEQYLETDLYIGADGELYFRGKFGSPDRRLAGSDIEFYVDPRDDIIKRNRRRITHRQRANERHALERAERAAVFRELPDGSELHLIDGVWFHCTVEDAPFGHIEYDKPANKDVFKGFSSLGRSWDKLSYLERIRHGVERFVGATALDVVTRKHVYSAPGKPPVRYRATKRTASHKLLKQVGLVGR